MHLRRIKNLREDSDLTQEELAKTLKISQRSYSYYETGEREVPLDILIALAEYYDVSTDYLLEITDKKN